MRFRDVEIDKSRLRFHIKNKFKFQISASRLLKKNITKTKACRNWQNPKWPWKDRLKWLPNSSTTESIPSCIKEAFILQVSKVKMVFCTYKAKIKFSYQNSLFRIIHQKARIWTNNFSKHRREGEQFLEEYSLPNKSK